MLLTHQNVVITHQWAVCQLPKNICALCLTGSVGDSTQLLVLPRTVLPHSSAFIEQISTDVTWNLSHIFMQMESTIECQRQSHSTLVFDLRVVHNNLFSSVWMIGTNSSRGRLHWKAQKRGKLTDWVILICMNWALNFTLTRCEPQFGPEVLDPVDQHQVECCFHAI